MNYKLLAFLLSCSLFCCQASPIKRRTDDSLEEEQRRLREVNCALHLTTALEPTYNFPLSHKILCYMYDQYIKYTDQVSKNGPLPNDYGVKQHLTWRSLNSTCHWVQLKENDSPPGCSLHEIREACAAYPSSVYVHAHIQELKKDFNEHWITSPNINNTPKPNISKLFEPSGAVSISKINTIISSKPKVAAACQ